MTEASENKAELDLGVGRVIPLRINGELLTWHFGVIGAKEWRRYFAGIINEVEKAGEKRTRIFDADCALVTLVRDVVQKVEGLGELGTGWRNKLRVPHCLAVGRVLRSVAVENNQDQVPSLSGECIEVSLSTPWTQGQAGHMEVFSGLVHRFKQPTIDQTVRWRRQMATSYFTERGAWEVTSYPSPGPFAMKMYDELIAEVSGYALNGQSLDGAAPKDIAAAMDGMHKMMAVWEVFTGSDRISLGEDTDVDAGDGDDVSEEVEE